MPQADRPDLPARLLEVVPAAAAAALTTTVEICRRSGVGLYLVGGSLRDLLLGRPHVDLDLAVEAEVGPLAHALGERLAARVVVHRRFGTAVLRGPGFELDLARTRRERYPRPGALPEVEPADLGADLARRDFTVNAMALALAPTEGRLVDPHGGLADLAARRIRSLHDASFQDDATRILRAVRYAGRLGFRLSEETEAALRRDLSYLDSLSGPRRRRELILLLNEGEAVAAARLAADLGVLAALHVSLALTPAREAAWRRALAGRQHGSRVELGLCLIVAVSEVDAVTDLARHLHLDGRLEAVLRDFVRLSGLSGKLARSSLPSEAVELLDRFAPAAVWAVSVCGDGVAATTCRRYLEQWRRVRPRLDGDDLLALGVPAGPAVGAALRALRRARLDGLVTDQDEEEALALVIAARRRTEEQ
jgi:tRNA nucleotidyltransferase (CCA-adding enzyme)